MAALVVLVTAALGVSSSIASYNEASIGVDRLLESTGQTHVDALDDYLHILLLDTATLAESGAVTSGALTFDQRQANIKRIYSARDDISSLYTVNSAGIALNDAAAEDVGENYKEEPFFIVGMEHEGGYIDVPYYDDWTENITMTISYKLNNTDGFSGLVCEDVSYDTVRKLTTSNTLGETGYNFLMDRDGVIRSHDDESLVANEMGALELFAENKEASAFLVSMQTANFGKSGDFAVNGETVRMYCNTIETTGWKYVSVIKVGEFMSGFRSQLFFTVITAAACLLAAFFIALVLSRRIASPISVMRKRMELLAAGDLHSPLPENKESDEIGILYVSMEMSLRSLSAYVADITENMRRLADGDLRAATAGPSGAGEYIGDYLSIKESMDSLRASLHGFFEGTGNAARLIAATSIQMASASEELSGNTIEQAAAIDRIDRRFEEIKNALDAAAENASETLAKTISTRDELVRSSEDMNQMLDAMRDIGTTAGSIVKIVKEIDDIAFLSSILSLNAAIEAARAGVHGKGFSVVADEVRELAGKSAKSAQYTETLITGAIVSVERGKGIAEATSQKTETVSKLLGVVAGLIENIEATVAKQAAAAKDIYKDLSNLNMLVQNDTAMSEETASASIELSQRMSMLHHEMEFFKTGDE
jgi:methyl-accepting chemotaxis protein